MNRNRVVVITGLSGSGKTVVLDALEDVGFFCVDNLPAALFGKLLELGNQPGREITRFALAMDAREREALELLPPEIDRLRAAGENIEVFFLEATPEILQRRYSVTRRPHPMFRESSSLADAIDRERELLEPLRRRANCVIDTSEFSLHQLREEIFRRLSEDKDPGDRMKIALTSFGFTKGLPHNADLVFDVRFLPNPFFVAELKNLSGADAPVAQYIAEREPTEEFLAKLGDLIEYLVPHYRREGKSYLTIAIGCTGGRHRSVFTAERLGDRLGKSGLNVSIKHRDLKPAGRPGREVEK